MEAPGTARQRTESVGLNGEGAGSCTYSVAVSKLARSRAFLVKPLVQGTFDVFMESAGFCSIAGESTEFVETFWRRREPVPVACRRTPPSRFSNEFASRSCSNAEQNLTRPLRRGRIGRSGSNPAISVISGAVQFHPVIRLQTYDAEGQQITDRYLLGFARRPTSVIGHLQMRGRPFPGQ